MIEHSDSKVQAVCAALCEQRNEALDRVAVLTTDLAESNTAILVLSNKVAALQKALDSPPTAGHLNGKPTSK